MADETEPDSSAADPHVRGLSRGERWAATAAGIVGVGTGGLGIFLSDNQAGTTAILLLGAVFLLMGVQGTAITKASKESVELERRRAGLKVLEKAAERIEAEEPDEAKELAEAAQEVDPSLAHDPSFSTLTVEIYRQQVFNAFPDVRRAVESELLDDGRRLGVEVNLTLHGRRKLDIMLVGGGGGLESRVAIKIAKAGGRNLPAFSVRGALQIFKDWRVPGLIISNQVPEGTLSNYKWGNTSDVRYDVVQWRSRQDNDKLVDALVGLLKPSDG